MSLVPWTARRKLREADEPLPLLPGYGGQNPFQRKRRLLAGVLFVLVLFYALAFHIIGRFIPVYFMIPFAILVLLVIWALPETGRPPVRALAALFSACLAGQLFWPDYFAIALPGLPWITVLRLTAMPMTFVLMIALSVSAAFRARLKVVIGSAAAVTTLLLVFTGIEALSLVFSNSMFHSFNRLVNAVLGWTSVFFVAAYLFSRPGNARRMAIGIWAATAFWLAIALWEWRLGHVPWQGSIPSFLATDDETVQRVLEGTARYAGSYRIQAKFFTPISFAEFLALATPFVLHWMMSAERVSTRIAAGLMLPAIFVAIIGTDSRLGAAGFMVACMAYAFFWGVRRWRYVRESVLGPAIVIAYPVLFSVFMAATVFVGRVRKMVWGSGQHASSNEAREVQFEMAVPLLKAHPWGYGAGMSGSELGYFTPSGLLTIDSYYLSVMLDFGLLGFVVYLAMFVSAIYVGGRRAFDSPEGETLWIVPATITLINFVIIKAVLAQVENHLLVFALLGMVVALGWRIRQAPPAAIRAPRDATGARPRLRAPKGAAAA